MTLVGSFHQESLNLVYKLIYSAVHHDQEFRQSKTMNHQRRAPLPHTHNLSLSVALKNWGTCRQHGYCDIMKRFHNRFNMRFIRFKMRFKCVSFVSFVSNSFQMRFIVSNDETNVETMLFLVFENQFSHSRPRFAIPSLALLSPISVLPPPALHFLP
jgi:hypothetical protein